MVQEIEDLRELDLNQELKGIDLGWLLESEIQMSPSKLPSGHSPPL